MKLIYVSGNTRKAIVIEKIDFIEFRENDDLSSTITIGVGEKIDFIEFRKNDDLSSTITIGVGMCTHNVDFDGIDEGLESYFRILNAIESIN